MKCLVRCRLLAHRGFMPGHPIGFVRSGGFNGALSSFSEADESRMSWIIWRPRMVWCKKGRPPLIPEVGGLRVQGQEAFLTTISSMEMVFPFGFGLRFHAFSSFDISKLPPQTCDDLLATFFIFV